MKDLIITPKLAQEVEQRNKPAILTISKMNVVFNDVATTRLALKVGVKFQLIIKDGNLNYKDVAENGFEIKSVKMKGASFVNKGLFAVLSENVRKQDVSFRFEIGEFSEGMRLLTEIAPKAK